MPSSYNLQQKRTLILQNNKCISRAITNSNIFIRFNIKRPVFIFCNSPIICYNFVINFLTLWCAFMSTQKQFFNYEKEIELYGVFGEHSHFSFLQRDIKIYMAKRQLSPQALKICLWAFYSVWEII